MCLHDNTTKTKIVTRETKYGFYIMLNNAAIEIHFTIVFFLFWRFCRLPDMIRCRGNGHVAYWYT